MSSRESGVEARRVCSECREPTGYVVKADDSVGGTAVSECCRASLAIELERDDVVDRGDGIETDGGRELGVIGRSARFVSSERFLFFVFALTTLYATTARFDGDLPALVFSLVVIGVVIWFD